VSVEHIGEDGENGENGNGGRAVVFGRGLRSQLASPGGSQYSGIMLELVDQYEAFKRRDPAWDGVVFVAVKTTRIYCRPVCPARTPLARNVRFYRSAASAERAGFRPCLRCRPETAPFCPAWKGTKTTVERALTLIEKGALDRGNVDQLADRLGIGSRHLSRLFVEHLDASPLQVALSLRVRRAKLLLDDTDYPIQLIAERAGFSSARRMNAAFKRLYDRPPTAMRKVRSLNRRKPSP
jgi:AraC family transcriptional regulator of adaptative response/methylated-DNA-[protein]-cysteine methyltransferase